MQCSAVVLMLMLMLMLIRDQLQQHRQLSAEAAQD
jgi:hypothetical protein